MAKSITGRPNNVMIPKYIIGKKYTVIFPTREAGSSVKEESSGIQMIPRQKK